MRTRALRLAGLFGLLLGLLALPTVALAAPQITITPKQGPTSTLFLVSGVGFAPSTTYYLRVAPQGGGTPVAFDDASATSDADGVIIAGFSFGGGVPAGPYTASITSTLNGGTVLASTNFTLGGAKSGPDIAITPAQGKGGDTFILTGTGFAANTTYTLRLQSENRQTTIALNRSDVASDADGTIVSGFSLAASRPAGNYIAEVLTKDAAPTVLAGTTFALTGAAASPSPSASPAPSPSASPAPAPTATASPSPSPSASPLPSPSPTATASPSASPSPAPSPSASPSPSPTAVAPTAVSPTTVPPTTVPPTMTPRPSPSATLPIAPTVSPTKMPTATAIAPTPPATGNGGFLPGLPNTGAGGMVAVAQDTGTDIATPAATPRELPLLGLAMLIAASAVTVGVVRRRATK